MSRPVVATKYLPQGLSLHGTVTFVLLIAVFHIHGWLLGVLCTLWTLRLCVELWAIATQQQKAPSEI